MLSEEQKEKINERRLITVKCFLENNLEISDIDLAKQLKEIGISTSSSTVGRDLSSEETKNILIEKYGKEGSNIFDTIGTARKENLHKAKIKGGNNFADNNEATKDEFGRFTGSKRK